jgi:hypothetical protein
VLPPPHLSHRFLFKCCIYIAWLLVLQLCII